MEWISVKDRLPENDEAVLVFVPDVVCMGRIFNRERGWEHFPCSCCEVFIWSHEVTHWMPLPKGPDEKE